MKSYGESNYRVRITSVHCRSSKMTIKDASFASETMPKRHVPQASHPQSVAKLKARQSAKIREFASALASAGFATLDAQAKLLGLGRSTAWTILKSSHKGSGLSAKTVDRLLSVRQLPAAARATILEYIEEKASGRYGHSGRVRRKFITALSVMRVEAMKKTRARKAEATTGHERTNGASHSQVTSVVEARKPSDISHKRQASRRIS